MTPDDPMWDDLFHGCAFEAFVSVARETGGWPDSQKVRRLAYSYYEEALAGKNAAKQSNTAAT